MQFPRWDVMYGMERRRSASQREVGSSGNMGTELAGRTQGQGGKPRPTGNSVLSVCPEELRLAMVRPKTVKTSRRKGFVVSAWRWRFLRSCPSVSFSDQGPLQPREDEDQARFACPFGGGSIRRISRSSCLHLALVVFVLSVWWARELQTHFDELEGLLMQAASAQTADPVEDAKQAVPPRVLLLAFLVAG